MTMRQNLSQNRFIPVIYPLRFLLWVDRIKPASSRTSLFRKEKSIFLLNK